MTKLTQNRSSSVSVPASRVTFAGLASLVLALASSPFACASQPEEETSCGPGTALANGQCIPVAQCGAGTALVNGSCVPLSGQGGASGVGAGGGGSSGASSGGGQAGNPAGGATGGSAGLGGDGGKSGSSGEGVGGAQGGTASSSGGGNAGSSAAAGSAGSSSQAGGGSGGGSGAGGDAGAMGGGMAGSGGGGGAHAGAAGVASGSTGGTGGTGTAGAAGVGGATAGAGGESGAGGSALDEPCPAEPIDLNCSDSCGPKSSLCDGATCGGAKGPVLTSQAPIRYTIRTPSQPGVDPACVMSCGSGNTVYGLRVWVAVTGVTDIDQTKFIYGLRVRVNPPWRIEPDYKKDFCIDSAVKDGCWATNSGTNVVVHVVTEDPMAPAANVVIENVLNPTTCE